MGRMMSETPRGFRKKLKSWMRTNRLLVLTVVGVFLGIFFGFHAQKMDYSDQTMAIVAFPGEIMMRMLKMLILPLVISSTITGLANLNKEVSGKICLYSMTYYFTTTIMAAIFGTLMATIIHPGDPTLLNENRKIEPTNEVTKHPHLSDTLMDIVRNIFPDNLVAATFLSTKSLYVKNSAYQEGSNHSAHQQMIKSVQTVDAPNIIGLIVFCVIFGSIIGQMKNSKPMVDFFLIMNDAVMKMVEIVIWYTPFGIMSLLIGQIMDIENVEETVRMLGMYVVTNIVCCLIHGLVTLPAIYYFFTRKSPTKFYMGIMQALVTAFGTCSSLMTLPITKRCLEENNKINHHITRFVLPIGTNINMQGATFHAAISALFIARIHGIPMTIGKFVMVSLTAAIASIGMVGLPLTGLTYLLLVLTAVDLPTENITLLFAVDWLAERFRTVINVLGDCVGCGIVNHLCSKDLANIKIVDEDSLVSANVDFDEDESRTKIIRERNRIDCEISKRDRMNHEDEVTTLL